MINSGDPQMTPDRPIEVVDDSQSNVLIGRDANVVFYLLIWGETPNSPSIWVYQWCLFYYFHASTHWR